MSVKSPVTLDQISDELNLHKTQVKEWMKQLLEEKQVKKFMKPVRYQWIEKSESKQLGMKLE